MPSPFDYNEAIPAGFYDLVFRHGRGIRFNWHHLKFRAVSKAIGSAANLLDVGCGPGTFTGNYCTTGQTLGVDLSAKQIEYAKRHYGSPRMRFSTEPMETLKTRSERFAAVSIIELIEHLDRNLAIELLREARNLLEENGKLVLTTPNYGSAWPIIESCVNLVSSVSYENQHINKYTSARLTKDLATAGYRDVAITSCVGFAPFFGLLGNKAVELIDLFEQSCSYFGVGNLLLAIGRR